MAYKDPEQRAAWERERRRRTRGIVRCRDCGAPVDLRAIRCPTCRGAHVQNQWRSRFWSKVEKTDSCWNWIGMENGNGYGRYRIHRRFKLPHRVAYELLVGPIPDGLTLDHLCFNKLCVNPAHLEPVTNAENIRRAWARRK